MPTAANRRRPSFAFLEAIDYSIKNKDLLDAERAREESEINSSSRDKWPYMPR